MPREEVNEDLKRMKRTRSDREGEVHGGTSSSEPIAQRPKRITNQERREIRAREEAEYELIWKSEKRRFDDGGVDDEGGTLNKRFVNFLEGRTYVQAQPSLDEGERQYGRSLLGQPDDHNN